MENGYSMSGDFSVEKGEYKLAFIKGKQVIEVEMRHDNYDISMFLDLKHLSLFGYDLVVVGKVTLEPDISFWAR